MKRSAIATGKVRRNMLLGGAGLIGTGFVSIGAWAFDAVSTACNCPSIPANATAQQAASICHCVPAALGFLPVGILAIAFGGAILLFSRELQRICLKRRRKRGTL